MTAYSYIDTHIHMDDETYREDIEEVVNRAREAGVEKVFLPAIDLKSIDTVMDVCRRFPAFAYPMLGLHPEEVKADYEQQLCAIDEKISQLPECIAIGEVGLDFYWSREFEQEQLIAFETQVQWAIDRNLPLMIHCRKAQNEMVKILRKYVDKGIRGVFHCFTGNLHEAEELLAFPGFVLGIGGVLTFKKSKLPEVVPHIPLDRIVLETDGPYMAPVPMRGKRNESAYIVHVIEMLATCYEKTPAEIAHVTTQNVYRVFGDIDKK